MQTQLNRLEDFERELKEKQDLFSIQPVIVQRYIEAQARQISEALVDQRSSVKFSLPDKIVGELPNLDQPATIQVPSNQREQSIGSLLNKLQRKNIKEELRHKLNELEQSPDQAISLSSGLLKYSASNYLVHNVLPSGRTVKYKPEEEDGIPSNPEDDGELESAITQASDAITEDGSGDKNRGELQTPFVPYARKFYLPQWISVDNRDHLLIGSLKEAEANLVSMQSYLNILHLASSIAPYILADAEYQSKRYGMLGQLVNQGRAVARYKILKIIETIKSRAAAGTLNRGLSLSLPYFDDQDLTLSETKFEVIPAGRIMFVSSFVVRAAREESAKRIQDTRFNSSTRHHLLLGLKLLEEAFTK